MAVIQNPIIGRAKNKFSNAIFSTWVGKNVLRSKPLSVSNPRTERQLVNRARIAFLARGAKVLRPVILSTLRSLRQGQTQYNAFASLNYPSFAPFENGAPAEIQLRPDEIVFTTGTLDVSGVGVTSSLRNVDLSSFSPATRENLIVHVAYFSVPSGIRAENPFLGAVSIPANGAMDVVWPPMSGTQSVVVAVENRVTGQNGQKFAENL